LAIFWADLRCVALLRCVVALRCCVALQRALTCCEPCVYIRLGSGGEKLMLKRPDVASHPQPSNAEAARSVELIGSPPKYMLSFGACATTFHVRCGNINTGRLFSLPLPPTYLF
jgi:hypothetical protein